jgi:hypothetical protein
MLRPIAMPECPPRLPCLNAPPIEMTEKPIPCDLCGLPVDVPDFELTTRDGIKHFCCEGCLGIYTMLHEDEVAASDDD